MIFYLTALSASACLAFFLKKKIELAKKEPNLKNVLKILDKIPQDLLANESAVSEQIVEEYLFKHLKKHFKTIQRQYVIGNHKSKRERIDLDLGNGNLGIEIKLAKLLRKTNERNRLLGQIDLYKTRKYANKPIIVIIVGTEENSKDENLIELREILANKQAFFYYLKLTQSHLDQNPQNYAPIETDEERVD